MSLRPPSLLRLAHGLRLKSSASVSIRSAQAYFATESKQDLSSTASELSPALNAFVARTGFNFPAETLLQSLTHKSYNHGQTATSERLEYLGQQAINLYVTEFVHSKYPNIPAEGLKNAVDMYTSPNTLAELARRLGVPDVMRWKPNDTQKSGQQGVSAKIMTSLIGALYHSKGSVAAKKFIHATILSTQANMEAVIKIQQPKRLLSVLMKRMKMDRPVSRILHETGRQSAAPVFVVGVFSGTSKIGEGVGSSIQMAEHRAATNALMKHFLEEIRKPILPSETESLPEEQQLSFIGPKLGDTAPIL